MQLSLLDMLMFRLKRELKWYIVQDYKYQLNCWCLHLERELEQYMVQDNNNQLNCWYFDLNES